METLGSVGRAVLLLAENLFPPIPSELVLALADFFVARGELSFASALVDSNSGSIAGALILHALGRLGGLPISRKRPGEEPGKVRVQVSTAQVQVEVPAFPAQLYDSYVERLELLRLATWNRLERVPKGDLFAGAQFEGLLDEGKRDAIAGAQRAGWVDPGLAPSEAFSLVTAMAVTWSR